MDDDGQFDYRTLTRAQIEYTLQHIDGSKYPMNLTNARAALDARNSGVSPEPAPILDEATDAKYTYWVEKLFAILMVAYAAIGLFMDDLVIPYFSRASHGGGVIRLHGYAAWVGALAIMLFAVIPFFGGLVESDELGIVPRFRYVFRFAILLILVAVAMSFLNRSG